MPEQVNQPTPPMQQEAIEERIFYPELAVMIRAPAQPKVSGNVMPAVFATAQRPPVGASMMQAFVPPAAGAASGKPAPHEAMRPRLSSGPAVSATHESYVRLRVRVVREKMTILSVHEVDGPLTLPRSVNGEFAYEAMLDSRPIAIEGIADLGVSRSYPRPDGHEHHFTDRPTVEFTVRVPRAALPDDALNRVTLTLYRFPDASPKRIEGSLSKQIGLQARAVAQLDALHLEVFAPEAIEQARRIFPRFQPAPRP